MNNITLFEYAQSIYNNPDHPLCMNNIITDLKYYENMLNGLHNGTVKPSFVIGTGYKYPKKAAIEWLNKVIREHQDIINGVIIHSTIKANYEYCLRNNKSMVV